MDFTDIIDLFTAAKPRKICFVLRTYLQFWISFSSISEVRQKKSTNNSINAVYNVQSIKNLSHMAKIFYVCKRLQTGEYENVMGARQKGNLNLTYSVYACNASFGLSSSNGISVDSGGEGPKLVHGQEKSNRFVSGQ